ncbi:MAG: SMC-Scp complex subunit ScpB [Candidatus Micrarchaeaceae archaeon]
MERASDSSYRKIAEAALFVSGRAMDAEEMAEITGIASVGHVRKMLDELMGEFNNRDSSLVISKIGDRYVIGIRSEYIEKVNSLAGAPDISRSSLRILAYISKNEPVMQNQVVKAFGSSSYGHIKELLEKDFISAVRVGRTKRIDTTGKFKEYFNL